MHILSLSFVCRPLLIHIFIVKIMFRIWPNDEQGFPNIIFLFCFEITLVWSWNNIYFTIEFIMWLFVKVFFIFYNLLLILKFYCYICFLYVARCNICRRYLNCISYCYFVCFVTDTFYKYKQWILVISPKSSRALISLADPELDLLLEIHLFLVLFCLFHVEVFLLQFVSYNFLYFFFCLFTLLLLYLLQVVRLYWHILMVVAMFPFMWISCSLPQCLAGNFHWT